MDFNTVSHQYASFDTQSITYNVGGHSLANLRFGVKHGSWQSSLFVTNLFNKYFETGQPIAQGVGLPTTHAVGLNRPRTVGVDLRFDY
jgi:iron complex outermembrane recepter protein